MPFWSKSNSSQSSNPEPSDHGRSSSGMFPPTPPPMSDQQYDPYRHQQGGESYNSSSQSFQPLTNNLQPPDPNSFAGPNPYQQYSPQEPGLAQQKPIPPHEDTSTKKSLKSRLFAASGAREDPPEKSLHHQEKGLFGRRRSVRRQDSPPPLSQEQSLYHENSSAQWSSEAPRPGAPRRTQSNRFEAFTPHFTLDQVDRRDQQPKQPQQLQQSHAATYRLEQAHHPGHPSGPSPIHLPHIIQTQQYTHLAEPTPSSAGSERSPEGIPEGPGRPSFDSLRQPSSVANTASRPSSRQSVDPRVGQQHQYISYRTTPDTVDPADQAGPSSAAQRAAQYQHQRRGTQQENFDPDSTSPRSPGNILQAPGMLETAHNTSGLSPNPAAGTSSDMTTLGQSPMPNRGGQGQGDAGRAVQGAARQGEDVPAVEYNQLMEAHREMNYEYTELKKKYNNVKRQYFAQKEQVDSLHNTLANQRLTVSRTLLDDGEYVKRMARLEGLVSQLAFGIRKDWTSIPEWLQGSVNKDALQIGKQEMTAVGRAFMSRWLADEIFDKYFHPDLSAAQSCALKAVNRNIRAFAAQSQSSDDDDGLTAKINIWRLTTIDGLKPLLFSPQALENRRALVESLTKQLQEDAAKYLKDPLPADLTGGIPMIIELAVGMLANLPQESRDVHIEYFLPGQAISEDVMNIESGIPPLAGGPPSFESADNEQASGKQSFSEGAGSESTADDAGRKGFLGGIMGGTKKGAPPTFRKQSNAGLNQQQPSAQSTPASAAASNMEDVPRVRIAAALAIQIRGKMVLTKAPVYKF